MTIGIKGNYFIDYQFKDGRLASFDLNRTIIIKAVWTYDTLFSQNSAKLEFCSIHSISEEN